MKRFLAIIAFALTLGFCSAQTLPAEASNFLQTFFPNETIIGVAEYAPSDLAFRVELEDNLFVYFNADGQWQIVECFSTDISTLLSQKMKDNITSQGNNPVTTVKIERNRPNNETRVTFSDGLSMVYDANGNFLRKEY